MTGAFMATRMLYAMTGGAERVAYQTFLERMDPALRLSLRARHLMQFIQAAAGTLPARGDVCCPQAASSCGCPLVRALLTLTARGFPGSLLPQKACVSESSA